MSDNKKLFKKVDYSLNALISDIDGGDIGLPDIQRPFVWTNAKVRDLLDSMFKGYPVGYFLFWESAPKANQRFIGMENKRRDHPHLLIIDGQQRLTSLYAVFTGRPVLNAEYKEMQVEISFRPRDGEFTVATAATRRNPEYIPSVTAILTDNQNSYSTITQFLGNLKEKKEVSLEDEKAIANNISRLFALYEYPFTALEISHNVDEEDVADIFVRINSKGVALNQSDFILTLLSVFKEDARKAVEDFCKEATQPPKDGKPSPYNHFIQPSPSDLLRVTVAYGFHRGKLKSMYQVLRGKDLKTLEFKPEERDTQFTKFDEAQQKVLNITSWHNYFNALIGAGYRSREMITSDTTLMYCYAFYLIGKHRFKIQESRLQQLIGKWFFACSLTSRYVGSFESQMDSDMSYMESAETAEEYISWIERAIASQLTNDFWAITLPSELETSSARTPYLFAFFAAQNNLDAPVLFSYKKIASLLDPAIKSTKKNLERHHIFPKAHLEAGGITDKKLVNQVANFALLEWPDNIEVSNDAPSKYAPEMRKRYKSDEEWQRVATLHALPDGWENMEYKNFLELRRKLMADIIKQGFEKVSGYDNSTATEEAELRTA